MVVGAGVVVGSIAGSIAGAGAVEAVPGVATPDDVDPTLPPAPVAATGSTARGGGVAVHVQVAGQSASTLHVVALGEQKPGKLVVVVHESGGRGAPAPEGLEAAPEEFELEPPPEVVPAVPTAPPPEQAVVTDASQLKPSPQSLPWLQGSCHLYAHAETFVSVQTGGAAGVGAGHATSLAHASAVPPLHSDVVDV